MEIDRVIEGYFPKREGWSETDLGFDVPVKVTRDLQIGNKNPGWDHFMHAPEIEVAAGVYTMLKARIQLGFLGKARVGTLSYDNLDGSEGGFGYYRGKTDENIINHFKKIGFVEANI